MDIKGSVHLLFEQSGVFKNEFIKLGYDAYDYDIQNNFGQVNYIVDIFHEIDEAYIGRSSIFDRYTKDELIVVFFPCIYFCQASQISFLPQCKNYSKLSTKDKYEKIIKLIEDRAKFFTLLNKLFCIVRLRGLRMIVENPYHPVGYLAQTFEAATFIDKDRTRRGDYFTKPTQYWFVGCKPTTGYSYQKPKKHLSVDKCAHGAHAGLCSEERSMLSPDYARNFICDFIIGKKQWFTQTELFE